MPVATRDCAKVWCACVLPPFAVRLEKGCHHQLCLAIVFTCIGCIPGIVYAYCNILECTQRNIDTEDEANERLRDKSNENGAAPRTEDPPETVETPRAVRDDDQTLYV